jgi:hypothetical protein
MTVLNPFRRVNEHIMDDADLAGPLIFCFFFATFLLFVCPITRHILHHLTMCSPESHNFSDISTVLRY